MTLTWTRDELEQAFRLHESTIATASQTHDWEPFVQLFVPEVEYIDPMVGTMRGHESLREWVNVTLASFPGSAMTFPEAWHVVDEERGRIVCELRNVLRDPGDGSRFERNNISVLTYAGAGRFLSEQDWYDPAAFITLIEQWGRHCGELGSLSAEERAWFEGNMPSALEGLEG